MRLKLRLLVLMNVMMWIFSAALMAQVTAVRSISDINIVDSTVTVTITVDVDEANAVNGIILNEYKPSAWTVNVESISPPVEPINDEKIKWVFWGEIEDMTITYTLSVPEGDSGTKTFDGDLKYKENDNNFTEIISGETAAVGNNPPTVPQLVYPENDQPDMDSLIVFKWSRSTDAEGGAVTYDLQICEDDQFLTTCFPNFNIASKEKTPIYFAGSGLGLLLFGIVLAGGKGERFVLNKKNSVLFTIILIIALTGFIGCGSGGGGNDKDPQTPVDLGVSYRVQGLAGGTEYFWKVIANDEEGGQTESEVRSFKTRN